MTNKQLFARIRLSSKFFYQNERIRRKGEKVPFPVVVNELAEDGYVVKGGSSGGRYRMKDVDLFTMENGEWVCVSEPESELKVQLCAVLKPTSPHFNDNEFAKNSCYGLPFLVGIVPDADFGRVVVGGPNDYTLDEVILFVGDLQITAIES